jgi:hypothetical protein
MPLGRKFKIKAQVKDQKSYLSGPIYADGGWRESNVLTVKNTPPTTPAVSFVKTGLGAWVCTLGGSRDPDVDCGFQSLDYNARIFKKDSPGGEFRETLPDGTYTLPFYEDANYCCEGFASDGNLNSSVINSCSFASPVVKTCGNYGLSAVLGDARIGGNKVDLDFNLLCLSDANLSSVKFKDTNSKVISGGSIYGPLPFICTSSVKKILTTMDSNVEGTYEAIFSYSDLSCTKSVYFTVITPESPISNMKAVPDSNFLAVFAALLVVVVIISTGKKK